MNMAEELLPLTDWYGWRFHDQAELVDALEHYGSIAGRPKVARLGDWVGDEPDDEGYLLRLRQNSAIDRAMARLGHMNKRLHRLLHAYYRRDLHTQHDGWRQAMRAADLDWHCCSVREELELSWFFDRYLEDALAMLFFCHNFRCGR
jgi:hypothetical protein